MIPYNKQEITNEDIASVVKVLKSDFLTQGPLVPIFEKKISQKVKSKYSVATNSATSALHISCLSLGLKKGDYLWTSANSFVASSNCGLYCGATVKFIDIDLETFNISYEILEKELIKASKKNRLPKIVIPVHFAGLPSDQNKIYQLSKKYNFKIIEDASHSLGSKLQNERVGSCKWSNISIFSFHPIKTITTGEGGIATTNGYRLIYEPLASVYHWHGINHGVDKNRADKIIQILENQDGFFNYKKETLNINSKAIAIIPIRGESIRFKDITLLEKTIQIAKKSKFIKDIFVTTDNVESEKIAKTLKIKVIKRPEILSEKYIDVIEVARYALNKLKYDSKKTPILVVLQETYPFRNEKTIDNMIIKMIKNNYDTIIPVRQEGRGFWIKDGKKISKDNYSFTPRSLKDREIMFNLLGLCFVSKIEYVSKNVWRNSKINYFNISDDISTIEIRNSYKMKKVISSFDKFSYE